MFIEYYPGEKPKNEDNAAVKETAAKNTKGLNADK